MKSILSKINLGGDGDKFEQLAAEASKLGYDFSSSELKDAIVEVHGAKDDDLVPGTLGGRCYVFGSNCYAIMT
jgi:hypothetical protein